MNSTHSGNFVGRCRCHQIPSSLYRRQAEADCCLRALSNTPSIVSRTYYVKTDTEGAFGDEKAGGTLHFATIIIKVVDDPSVTYI